LSRLGSEFQDDLRNQRQVSPELRKGHHRGGLEKAELGGVEAAERGMADRSTSSLYESAPKRTKRIRKRKK